MTGFWDDARHAELVKLVERDGLTAQQAASALGCTRNAVIGRADRHDLVFLRSPALTAAKRRANTRTFVRSQETRRCAA